MTADELIAAARDLATRPSDSLAGVWPRASAHLARQALEQALDQLWGERAPAAAESATATQLVCLSSYISDGLAGDVGYAWWSLTRASHYHPYELPPTAEELLRTIEVVERLVAQLRIDTPADRAAARSDGRGIG